MHLLAISVTILIWDELCTKANAKHDWIPGTEGVGKLCMKWPE